jgi:hypothetical protein
MRTWKMIGFPGACYDHREWIGHHNQRFPLPPWQSRPPRLDARLQLTNDGSTNTMATRLPPRDVVIIGLRWTGSILAEQLAAEGLDVVAIKRGPRRRFPYQLRAGQAALPHSLRAVPAPSAAIHDLPQQR